jgi:hypothetical protein
MAGLPRLDRSRSFQDLIESLPAIVVKPVVARAIPSGCAS